MGTVASLVIISLGLVAAIILPLMIASIEANRPRPKSNVTNNDRFYNVQLPINSYL